MTSAIVALLWDVCSGQRYIDDIADCADIVECHALDIFGLDVCDVLAIVNRKDDLIDSSAFRRENFFLYASYRQNFAAKSQLSGHGYSCF